MVGFTPPYCPLMPYKWGGLLWSLLRNPKEQWIRVYGCPEEMPCAARLPNNPDLTEHWSGYSLVRPLLALRISLAGKDHPGIRYEPNEYRYPNSLIIGPESILANIEQVHCR